MSALTMSIFIIPMIVALILVIYYSWRILNWVWLRPKKLEKFMRAQGLNGNTYKFLYGDLKEMTKVIQETNSKPIHLSDDDVVPRSIPNVYQLVQKYGVPSFQWWGPRPTVHIMDPQLVNEVFSKHYKFVNRYFHPLDKYWLRGVATYDGDKWAKHRKLLNPAFHTKKLKLMLPAFHLSCMDTLSKWENLVDSPKTNCELDIWPDLQTLTSDAISRTAFGSNYEEGRKVFELQKEQTQLMVKIWRSVYLPGMQFLPTKINRRIKEISKEIEFLVTKLINRRITAIKVGDAITDDLLGILLESNLKEIQDQGNRSSAMSTKEIIEECKLFYFAGQETTSTLLVWTMILLCKHPEWQERARNEVLQVFGYEKPGFEDLNKLKTVTMILNEVLRLFPPVPVTIRRPTEEMKLGNFILPTEVHVLLPTILLHHDLELWGSDAKEFKPERFIEGALKATKGNASFFPFGQGPRTCIGQNFALLEAKVALSMILQRFSFKLSPSYAHAPCNMLTLRPQYGAHLILHKM